MNDILLSPVRRRAVALTLMLLTFAAQTHAGVTTVAWYRFGEQDPGATPGQLAGVTTANVLGGLPLGRIGSPEYTADVADRAREGVGSSMAMRFNGLNQGYSNAVVTTPRARFGIEAWVKPAAFASGPAIIAYNGDPLSNGWGLYWNGNGFVANYAGIVFGPVPGAMGEWTHVALVHDDVSSTLYLNGIAAYVSSIFASPAAGAFSIAGDVLSPGAPSFAGLIDEVRVFTFEFGQFSPVDLLVNQTRVVVVTGAVTPGGASVAQVNGEADGFGLATASWFEWGPTMNLGQRTPPVTLQFGQSPFGFSGTLTGLTAGSTYFYRAMVSNAVGVANGNIRSFEHIPTRESLALYGGVKLRIDPPGAVADGASWRLDGGLLQASGVTRSNVAPGRHTIDFGDLPGWLEPHALEVLVVGGGTSEVSVVFTPASAFDFLSIPEQHVRQGETLEFFVRAGTALGTFQVTASPTPVGVMSFDPATGRFAYRPAPADRLPFTVTFSTSGQSGTTLITPLPELLPEDLVIQYDRALPDEASRDFITISENQHAAEEFNDQKRPTFSVDISGKTLVFDAAHPALLHQQYSERENVKEFRLFADRVIIRSPLLLPQTHVSIHARELRFEGEGQINTTPRARSLPPPEVTRHDGRSVGFDGYPGYPGGDVDVMVERFYADPTPAIRFVQVGGGGGPAGPGRDGVFEGMAITNEMDVTTYPYAPGSAGWSNLTSRAGNMVCDVNSAGVILYNEVRLSNGEQTICGSQVPARGEPGVPAGFPGVGGRGGILRSTLNLAPHAQLDGGAPGKEGTNTAGGDLFFRYIYMITTTRIVKGQIEVITSEIVAPKVRGTEAPAPAGSSGVPGSVVVTNSASWLHSFVARSVLQFAKDAYLNGRTTDARALVAEYRDAIRVLQPLVESVTDLDEPELAETTSLDQLALEMDALLHRLDSNLDYFGNPAGWAPMLSFEANLAAFENEVEQSIRILYLSYFLTQAATNLQNSLTASGAAVDNLREELDAMVTAYNEAHASIPRLRVESDNIQTRIAGLRSRLSLLEQELAARAAHNVEERHKVPTWKKALGVIAVAADLVPVGQPVVGRIGSKLGLLANIDPEHPVASAKTNAPKLFEKFTEKNIDICFTPVTTNATNASLVRKEKLKTLTECGKFLGQEVKELASVFKEAKIDSKEIAAELEKIKASDPVFQAVVADLTQLNVDKERFAQELAVALQIVAKLTGAMTENVLATDNLEARVAQQLSALDHNALLHVREMERRAKERLLQYQYFTAQAFQYRLLQAYGGTLQLNRLFDRFQALLAANNSHVLTDADFNNLKSIYIAELRDIVNQSLALLNSNAPERSQPARFSLVPEELEQLNRDGSLVLNLRDKGFFVSGRENIRIADLRTSQMTVRPVGGAIGGFALCFVDFHHQGISRLTSRGQSFLFRHYQTGDVNPIAWNTLFDVKAGTFHNSEISPAAQSLASFLIDQPTTEKLLLFSRPAADAELLITKIVSADTSVDLVIDAMEIQVEYEFFNTGATRPELTVNVMDDLEPVIAVSQIDVNGRRDGQGDFHRVYAAGTPVTLEAPASYGGLSFDRWLVNRQPRAEGLTSVTVVMTAPITVEAQYRSAQTQFVLTPIPAGSGQVGFQFSTTAGSRYTVERSFSLTDPVWTPLETLTGTGGPMQFTRPIAADSAFFRLVSE